MRGEFELFGLEEHSFLLAGYRQIKLSGSHHHFQPVRLVLLSKLRKFSGSRQTLRILVVLPIRVDRKPRDSGSHRSDLWAKYALLDCVSHPHHRANHAATGRRRASSP